MSAFAGCYSDLRFIKSRKVAQVVIELPIEQANRFLQAFGAPDPSKETWVAIARLNHAPESDNSNDATELHEPEKPRRQWEHLRPSARAAMLCDQDAFLAFLKVRNKVEADAKIKAHCGIGSKRELDSDETKLMLFKMIEQLFEAWKSQHHF